jgi:hypothetical protein
MTDTLWIDRHTMVVLRREQREDACRYGLAA